MKLLVQMSPLNTLQNHKTIQKCLPEIGTLVFDTSHAHQSNPFAVVNQMNNCYKL